jgi:hypothetical protein
MESSAHKDVDYLELRKHHAAFGGEDKNRMVTIASFILGFSAAVLGVVALLPVEEGSWLAFKGPRRAIVFSVLGIAAYTVLLTPVTRTRTGEKPTVSLRAISGGPN